MMPWKIIFNKMEGKDTEKYPITLDDFITESNTN